VSPFSANRGGTAFAPNQTIDSKLPPMLGVKAQARAVNRRMRSIARLNLELAKLEAKQKATALGIAGGLALVAVVLVFYAIGFGFAAAAAGLSESMPLWASLLVVAGMIVIVAAILGLLARHFARKASPPKPEQAIEEAERTMEMLDSHV
jgi:Putative Actinobacterial Holin-X, holin superfamily III